MRLWECFICGSIERCEHRELELMVWIENAMRFGARVMDGRIALLDLMRKPVGVETGRVPQAATRRGA